MTSHITVYSSSLYPWLPTVAPMLTGGVLNVLLAMPWRLKLTTSFLRHTCQLLSPKGANFPTQYGGNAAPVRLSTSGSFLWQSGKRCLHLLDKLDRTLARGVVGRLLHSRPAAPPGWLYANQNLRKCLHPDAMQSRDAFDPDALARLLNGSQAEWQRYEVALLRIATFEHLCQLVNFTPEKDFFEGE